jgi:hypothetical protein
MTLMCGKSYSKILLRTNSYETLSSDAFSQKIIDLESTANPAPTGLLSIAARVLGRRRNQLVLEYPSFLWHGIHQTMRIRLPHARRPNAMAIVLLAALVFRAYIPVGFMPASGTPFLLELCPAYTGYAHGQHEHHHSQGHADFQNCPFGSAPAPAPLSELIAFEPPRQVSFSVDDPAETVRLDTKRLRSHQPRGPPSPA